jgi:hypothetical protein
MTDAERQRKRYERIRASRPANKPVDPEREALVRELAAAKAEIAGLRLAIRFGPRPRKPKAEKPPRPPDEERDRQIKAQQTRIRNLQAELHFVRNSGAKAGMSFAMRAKIMKALHPDLDGHPESERAAARLEGLKAFSAWCESIKPRR